MSETDASHTPVHETHEAHAIETSESVVEHPAHTEGLEYEKEMEKADRSYRIVKIVLGCIAVVTVAVCLVIAISISSKPCEKKKESAACKFTSGLDTIAKATYAGVIASVIVPAFTALVAGIAWIGKKFSPASDSGGTKPEPTPEPEPRPEPTPETPVEPVTPP